jgi:hypothetical protein
VKRHVLCAAGLLPATGLLLLAGCGPARPPQAVSGKILEGGGPLKVSVAELPPGTRPVQLVFHEIPAEGERGAESYYSDVNLDTGEFTVRGPNNKGIPAGKYRISVTLAAGGQAVGNPVPGANIGGDRLQGMYSLGKTPLEVEITGPSRIIIDLTAGRATVEGAPVK